MAAALSIPSADMCLERLQNVIQIGAVAPVAGALSGPVGSAVGSGLGAAMKRLSAYDSLKSEAMGQMNQMGNVAAAARRGLRA